MWRIVQNRYPSVGKTRESGVRSGLHNCQNKRTARLLLLAVGKGYEFRMPFVACVKYDILIQLEFMSGAGIVTDRGGEKNDESMAEDK